MADPYTPAEADAVWDDRAGRRGLVGVICTDHIGTKIYVNPFPDDRASGWWTDPDRLRPLDGRKARRRHA